MIREKLIGPVMTIHGMIMGKKRKRLEASLTASEQGGDSANGEDRLTPVASG